MEPIQRKPLDKDRLEAVVNAAGCTIECWYEGCEPSHEDYKREKRYQRRVNRHSTRKYIEPELEYLEMEDWRLQAWMVAEVLDWGYEWLEEDFYDNF